MKALLILAFMLVVAATAFAYGHAGVAAGVTAMASAAPEPSEPAALLLSGCALLAIASALSAKARTPEGRRYSPRNCSASAR